MYSHEYWRRNDWQLIFFRLNAFSIFFYTTQIFYYLCYQKQFIKGQMLITSTYNLSLERSYEKVLHVYPAYNDTFVMLAILQFRTEVLVHLDLKGRVIKQKIFHNSELEELQMINDRELILLHNKQNLIISWNLETNFYLEIPFLFFQQQISDCTFLYIFHITKLLCIVQLGNQDHNILRLTYFQYPFQSAEIQAEVVFQTDQEWNYKDIVRKGDNSSMVLWAAIEFQSNPIFKLFEKDKETSEWGFKSYDLSEIQQWKPFSKIEISIGNMWSLNKNDFIITGITNEAESQELEEFPSSKFIFSSLNLSFRRSFFNIPQIYRNQHIDSQCIGNFSMIRTYEFEKGFPVKTPIFYINNLTEQLVATQYWQCSHLYKYETLGHLENGYVECQYENGNVKNCVVNTKQILTKKHMLTFFLTQKIEDCDEDLIFNVIDLIQDLI